uniref:Uncharacterized protein n=1 Tax=Chenopodium quinoa TaxID=63459 RepID=A0A803LKD2_CHEQI
MQISCVIVLFIFLHITITLPAESRPPPPKSPNMLFRLASPPSMDYSHSDEGAIISSASSSGEVQTKESIQHRHQPQQESIVDEDDYGYWNPVPYYDRGDAGPVPHSKLPH